MFSIMKKVVELSLNIVIHLKVDGDGTSSVLEYVGRWRWAEGPSIKDVGHSEGGRGQISLTFTEGQK